jgi:undecaprenyl-diphosphatase
MNAQTARVIPTISVLPVVTPVDGRDLPDWHHKPPFSPRHLYRTAVLVSVLVAVVTLGVLARYQRGRWLLDVDTPIQRWVVQNRDWPVLGSAGHAGDNAVVFAVAAIMAVIAWRRCRYLAVAIVAAAALRPGLEFVLKAAIGRARPDMSPMSDFRGPSHPSGHPMSFLSVWGLLPPLLALYRVQRWVWWTATGAVGVGAVVVAASRVYRGAHWTSDVLAALLWGSLYLLAVQVGYERWHHRPRHADTGDPAASAR